MPSLIVLIEALSLPETFVPTGPSNSLTEVDNGASLESTKFQIL